MRHLREVTEERARQFCEENDLSLVETSAKDNSNVEYAFQKLVSEIYQESIKKNFLEIDSNGMKFKTCE